MLGRLHISLSRFDWWFGRGLGFLEFFRGVRVEIFSCVLRLSRIDSVVVWRGSSCETIVSSAFHWPGIQRYRLNQLWNCAWPCSLVAVGNFFPWRGDLKSQGFCLLVRWFYFIRTMYTFILYLVAQKIFADHLQIERCIALTLNNEPHYDLLAKAAHPPSQRIVMDS